MQGQSSFDYNCDGFETLAVSNLGECQCDENIDPDIIVTNVYQLARLKF